MRLLIKVSIYILSWFFTSDLDVADDTKNESRWLNIRTFFKAILALISHSSHHFSKEAARFLPWQLVYWLSMACNSARHQFPQYYHRH